jgi:hypothetical protein
MYKVEYKDYIKVKQIAYVMMKAHNDKEYKKGGADKRFYTYKEVLSTIMRKDKEAILDLLEEYHNKIAAKENKKLIEYNDSTIIIARLKNITDAEVEHIKQQLIELERVYDLQLDTDYNDKHAVLMSYQQVLAYKYYDIEISRKPNVELVTVGDESLLDAMAR